MNASKNRAYRLVPYLALTLLVAGAGILLVTTEQLDTASQLWPLGAFLGGVLYCLAVSKGPRKGRTMFPGVLVASASLVYFFAGLARLSISDYWPFYMISAGLSVFVAGFLAYRRLRAGFFVPALGFVLLGMFFLVFSFGFSSMRFSAFLTRWWPGLVVVAGIILMALYALMRAIGPSAGDEADKP